MEMLELIAKCVFFYVVIVVSLRVMGKREVGELSVLDVVIYFVMSELLALSISEPDQSVGKALVAIATLSVLQISIAWACLKKKRWRDFFEGQPSLIIYDGIINQKEMKRQRYTIDDLMYQLRDRDISSPQEVQFAILENSGTLTVLKKDSSKLRWMDPLISDGIVQTFLVDNVSNGIFLTALDRTLNKLFGFLAGYNFDTIPLFNYLFLPSGNFFGLSIVIGSQQMETLGFLVVELLEVVVELTLHRIVRSNLGDRILDRLDPAFGIALLVACIVERQDFGLEDAIDSSSIKLILMFLILVSTFLSQSPTGTFTVTFEPPAVEYGEVDNTVHQSFFAGRTGSFERTGRRIQPDIYTGNKTARELHVVILEEDNLAEELGTT